MNKIRAPLKNARHKPLNLHALQRTLAAVQLQLKRSEQRIQSLERTVKKLENEKEKLRAGYERSLGENRKLKLRVSELENKLEDANKQLSWFKKDKYGRHSEVDAVPSDESTDGDSDSDFNSNSNSGSGSTAQANGKRKRGQQPGAKGHGRTDRSSLDTEDRDIEISDCACPTCAKPFLCLPQTDDSKIAEMDMMLFLIRYRRHRYVPQCKCTGAKMVTAPAPPRLYNRTTIGNSLWIHLIVWKFLHGVPINRVLKDLALQGLSLSAGTVTGGFKIINDLVQLLYDEIVEYCQAEQYWNADETSWRVFQDSNGKTSKKNWWLWLIAGDKAVVYLLDESRSGSVPQDFFSASTGTLMSDRYSAYKTLPDSIRKAWCWVHVRRDFLKIYDGVPKYRTWAKNWLKRIAKLFVLQHRRLRLWQVNRSNGKDWIATTTELQEHVQLLEAEWRKELEKFPPTIKRTVLQSLKRHWQGLTLFLSDPRISLHNSRAERLNQYVVSAIKKMLPRA